MSYQPSPQDILMQRLRRLEQQNARLVRQNTNLREQIRQKDRALARIRPKLSALYWVWCSGGCTPSSLPPLDEEIVLAAEYNTNRLRQKFTNMQYRADYRLDRITDEKVSA